VTGRLPALRARVGRRGAALLAFAFIGPFPAGSAGLGAL
jgi:hypothetical protein